MRHPHDTAQYVRRIVLPSGKAIDVVYYDGPSPVPVERAGTANAPVHMHVCGTCASPLVYPVDWEESGTTRWEVSLRCPECEWTGTGIFEQDAVERFDEELDRGMEVLVRDLKRLMHANMEDDVERFVRALEADHIVPEDF